MLTTEDLVIEKLAAANAAVTIVVLHGPISVNTYERLDAELDAIVREGTYQIIMDLSDVRYVSSAGAGVIMNALTQAREHGGDIILVNVSQGVSEIFDLLNLTDVLPHAEDLPSALKRFGA